MLKDITERAPSRTPKMLILLGLPLLIVGCEQSPIAPAERLTADDAPLLASEAGAGLVRTTWPSAEDPGLPYYARITSEVMLVVDGWAVIPFYRDPACVPAGFNLLDFFDAPAAFGCPLTVQGFSLWRGEAFVGSPKVLHSQGAGAVPFWFVPAETVSAAAQDGVLTIGELESLSGRIAGHATHFDEVLHPQSLPPFLGGGGHPNPKGILKAQGTLEDGRRFQFHVVAQDADEKSIRLRFW
jgi:hypothetical protein